MKKTQKRNDIEKTEETRDTQGKLKMGEEREGNKENRNECSHKTSSEMCC